MTQEQADAMLSKLENVASEATTSQLLNLNTTSSDTIQNALNADLKNQAAESQVANKEVEEKKTEISVAIHSDAKPSEKVDDSALTNVAIQEIKQDIQLGDSDLTKMIKETQSFFESYKDTAAQIDQVNKNELQVMNSILGGIEKSSANMQTFGDDLGKNLNGISNAEKPSDVSMEQFKLITDSMTGELGGIIKQQNDKMVVPKEASSEKSVPETGITGAGKALEMEGSKGKGDKEIPKEKPQKIENGLTKVVSNIERMMAQNLLLLSKVFSYLPIASNVSVNRQVFATSTLDKNIQSSNANIQAAIQVQSSLTRQILIADLAKPRIKNDYSKQYLKSNNTDMSTHYTKGINFSPKVSFDKIIKDSQNKITYNIKGGGLGGDGKPILSILKEMLDLMKESRANARAQAADASKKAMFAAQFGNVASASKATAKSNDNSGFLKGITKALKNIGPSILKGILEAKAKMWLFLISLIAMIVAFIWLLIKYPKLREKLWEFIKGIGTKLWNLWMKFWEGAGPKVKAIAIAIASLIGLMIFGPWGLLIGAVLLIASLWPKYKGWIIAIVAAIGITLLAIYSGPVGWIIARYSCISRINLGI